MTRFRPSRAVWI